MPKRNSPTMNQQAATPRAMAPTEPQMLTVKAVVDTLTDTSGGTYQSPRMVYDMQDMPIPHDRFITTPLTASLVLAIKAGDVEEEEVTPGLERGGLPAEFGGRQGEGRTKDKAEPKPEPPKPDPRRPYQQRQDERPSGG